MPDDTLDFLEQCQQEPEIQAHCCYKECTRPVWLRIFLKKDTPDFEGTQKQYQFVCRYHWPRLKSWLDYFIKRVEHMRTGKVMGESNSDNYRTH